MLSEGSDKLRRAGTCLLALAASLGAGMVAVGLVAWLALQDALARTYNVYVDWHTGQRFSLALTVAATLVLTAVTVVVMLATRRVTVQGARLATGVLAAALVFACALPTAGWFWLIFQDGLPSDREFVMDTYGRWYYPLAGVFGGGYIVAAAGAAVLLLLPRNRPADRQGGP